MKRRHTESRKGRRGHKWFPAGSSRLRMLNPTDAAGMVASILAMFGGKR